MAAETQNLTAAGDSRCVACRDGQAVAMTEDHKPTDAAENDRIVKVRAANAC